MAAIAYWCVDRHVSALQEKITVSAQAAVDQSQVDNVNVSVEGRAAVLDGMVENEAQRANVFNAVRNTDGIRQVKNNIQLLPQADVGGDEGDQSDVIVESAVPASNAADADESTPNTAENNQNNPSQPNGENTTATETETTDSNTATSNQQNDVESQSDASTASSSEAQTTNPETEPADSTETATAPLPDSNNTTSVQASGEQIDTTVDAGTEGDTDAELPLAETDPAEPGASVEAKANELIQQALQSRRSGNSLIDPDTPQTAKGSTRDTTRQTTEPTSNDTSSAPLSETNEQLSEANEQPVAIQSPTFSMRADGKKLMLSGSLSDEDNLLEFIQNAMTQFNANYVVNGVQVNTYTAKAPWLTAVTDFLPTIGALSEAGIDIIESQITLSGVADSNAQHDAVINAALTQLSELSLVERITVDDSANQAEKLTENAEQAPTEREQSSAAAAQAVTSNSGSTETDSNSLATAFNALENTTILFEIGSDVLTPESRLVVESIADVLSQYPESSVEIDGHTDASGNSAANLALSQLRANTVRDYLVTLGISAQRLTAYGFGDGVPIADNATAAGRRLNRRIEFNF